MSGSIRTVLNKYVAGQLYRVFVEARDHPASDGAINVKPLTRNSVIAIVEILAADRPPQFFRPKYHTSIAENLEIGSGSKLICLTLKPMSCLE
jgi:hypothetical protein